MRSIIKSNKRSLSFLKEKIFSFLLISLMLVGLSTFAVRPVQKDKPSTAKAKSNKITPFSKTTTSDYLLYIMPGAITKVTKKNAIYVKDAKGVYTMVEDRGC